MDENGYYQLLLPERLITRLNNMVIPSDDHGFDSGAVNALLSHLFPLDKWIVKPVGPGGKIGCLYTLQPSYPKDETNDPDDTRNFPDAPEFHVYELGVSPDEDIPNIVLLIKTTELSEERAVLKLAVCVEMLTEPLDLANTIQPAGVLLNGSQGARLVVRPATRHGEREYALSHYEDITSPSFLEFLRSRAQL